MSVSRHHSAMVVAPSAYLLSGLATWLDYLLPGLRDRGWRMALGLVEGARFHQPRAYLEQHPWDDWVGIRCRMGTEAGRRKALRDALKRERPDVVLSVNIPDVYPAVGALRNGRSNAPKVVATLHGILPALFADLRRDGRGIDAALCTNRLTCRLAEALGRMPAQRVHYAAYGVRMPAEEPRLPGRDARLRIAYVGRLESDQKRVMDIPAILRELDGLGVPFELVVGGSGPEEDAFAKAVAPWGDRVRMLGFVAPGDVASKVYAHADCLLITSRWETGPIVAWEAMVCGVPVVSSRYVGSGLEGALTEGGTALLFDVGDAACAAGQLAALWRNEARAQRIVREAYRMVSERYSIAASVDAWEQQLLRVLDAPPLEKAPIRAPRPSGRLDHLFGSGVGEMLRGAIGRACPENDPGGEWPFSYGAAAEAEGFWARAAVEDERAAE